MLLCNYNIITYISNEYSKAKVAHCVSQNKSVNQKDNINSENVCGCVCVVYIKAIYRSKRRY